MTTLALAALGIFTAGALYALRVRTTPNARPCTHMHTRTDSFPQWLA